MRKKKSMNGILLVNKSASWTSQDVCAKLKGLLHTKKIGHTGTLDPFAEGLLVLTIGKGTKIGQFIEGLTKTYIAKLSLGKATDTLDLTGNIIETKDVPNLTKEQIKEVLTSFKGIQKQIPPKYSAIKINGKRLYEYARENIDVEIKEREIEIFDIELIDYVDNEITFIAHVSKGTYIRTLASDIANKLNTVGHLKELIRTKVGKYDIKHAKKIDEINENDVINLFDALSFLKQIKVNDDYVKKVKDGYRLFLDIKEDMVLITDNNDYPLAIYKRKEGNTFVSARGIF